jgi:hypothetical protein
LHAAIPERSAALESSTAADHAVPSKSTHALTSEFGDPTDKEPREDHGEQLEVITPEFMGEDGNSRSAAGAAGAARTIYRPARPAHDAHRAAQRAPAGSARSPGAATLRMVEGRVLVRATNRAWRLAADDIVAGPPAIEEQV